jgi:hypothetical protein
MCSGYMAQAKNGHRTPNRGPQQGQGRPRGPQQGQQRTPQHVGQWSQGTPKMSKKAKRELGKRNTSQRPSGGQQQGRNTQGFRGGGTGRPNKRQKTKNIRKSTRRG